MNIFYHLKKLFYVKFFFFANKILHVLKCNAIHIELSGIQINAGAAEHPHDLLNHPRVVGIFSIP